MKAITSEAYRSLEDALASVTWYKNEFQRMIRVMLRDHPEILARVNFSQSKREASGELVQILIDNEPRYLDLIKMMILDLADRTHFPDIERMEEPNRSQRLSEASDAVERLKKPAQQLRQQMTERERFEQEREAREAQDLLLRQFEDELAKLNVKFAELNRMSDAQKRGISFEVFLSELFKIFDMEPQLAYRVRNEQIDGSLSFDTDDYIVEAKWQKERVGRADLDVFAAKVNRKGRNALGLFVAMNGFTSNALDQYQESTPFITMEGVDLAAVLSGVVRLDDLLKRKKRHANETGSCYLPAHLA